MKTILMAIIAISSFILGQVAVRYLSGKSTGQPGDKIANSGVPKSPPQKPLAATTSFGGGNLPLATDTVREIEKINEKLINKQFSEAFGDISAEMPADVQAINSGSKDSKLSGLHDSSFDSLDDPELRRRDGGANFRLPPKDIESHVPPKAHMNSTSSLSE